MRDVTADFVDLSKSRETMVALANALEPNPPGIHNLYVHTAADVSVVRDDGLNSYSLKESNETLTIDNTKITRAAGQPKAGRFYEVL